MWLTPHSNELLDDHRALEPPDPIPNSEVKRCIADGSVRFPHVRVGHRQALYQNPGYRKMSGVLLCALEKRQAASDKLNPKLEAGSWKLEAGSLKLEATPRPRHPRERGDPLGLVESIQAGSNSVSSQSPPGYPPSRV